MRFRKQVEGQVLGRVACLVVMEAKAENSGTGADRTVELVEYKARASAVSGHDRGGSEH